MGYIAFTDRQPGGWSLNDELLKVQDTIPICPPVISQQVALGALSAGKPWVKGNLASVERNREAVEGALVATLGAENVYGGAGAIYLFARLPVADDEAIVRQLAADHGVVVIPGSACGMPGHIRVAYANLETADCVRAAQRLAAGLEAILAAE